VRKASHCGSKQQSRLPNYITLLLLVRTTYIWVLFFAHIPFVVNRTFSATPAERLQQHPFLFTTNRSRVVFAKVSHSTTFTCLSQHHFVAIGKPERQGRKLHTVAVSNNRDHPTRSLFYCMFAPHIYCLLLFFAHIPFVVNRAFSATPAER